VSDLIQVARQVDRRVAEARAELVSAVRQAAAEGMTQAEIARQIGRSQPEVSRLLRFHGTTPLARRVRQHAGEIRRLITEVGGSQVRVFGSVSTGQDRDGSDVDLVFAMGAPLSLMELAALEQRIGELIGARVDLIPESAIRSNLRGRVLAEAVAL
jgi:predicted nucleotidyltransferase